MRRDVAGRCRSVQEVDRRLQIVGGIAQHLLPAQALIFSHGAPARKLLIAKVLLTSSKLYFVRQ